MHEVLVNRLGGLSLPRKSVVRLTDRPDMTLDVYRGRKTTIQQQQYWRDIILICLMMSNFISMTLEGVKSFSRIKILQNKYKRLCYSQTFGGISFHVMAENWQHMKGTLAFSSFFVS